MVLTQSSVYDKAVEISEDFLGPAGERFLRRQIDTHIGISPEALQKKHLPTLAKWAGLAFALLTKDTEEVTAFIDSLLALGTKNATLHGKTR